MTVKLLEPNQAFFCVHIAIWSNLLAYPHPSAQMFLEWDYYQVIFEILIAGEQISFLVWWISHLLLVPFALPFFLFAGCREVASNLHYFFFPSPPHIWKRKTILILVMILILCLVNIRSDINIRPEICLFFLLPEDQQKNHLQTVSSS